MVDIPKEYADADYGFSAIDEATYKAQQQENAETPPSIDGDDIKQALQSSFAAIEKKLDSLILKKNVQEDEEVDRAKAAATQQVQSQVTKLEKIIMPLLVNLLKTADKEYIHWPNREAQVKGTIDKILKITRA